MPITLNTVDGLIDATVVDDNFSELENFLKENVGAEDFKDKFGKFKIRRYTSGKIVSFNYGANPYSSSRDAELSGTFENNWHEGTPEKTVTLETHRSRVVNNSSAASGTSGTKDDDGTWAWNTNQYPMEFMGYPGSTLLYDFQEQGLPNPKDLMTVYGDLGDGDAIDVSDWPPEGGAATSRPADQCWTKWLTVPEAAGSVYVDEPCVAIITATVRGNYFFTPAMKVKGTNTNVVWRDSDEAIKDEEGDPSEVNVRRLTDYSGLEILKEGMDQSVFLRLGLFVDTNPIVYDDEFFNGDLYGNPVSFGSGAGGALINEGYNSWIGPNPTGKLNGPSEDTAKTRSWVMVKDVTYRVRQRNTYQITAAIQLKGRRKYNFSLKFKPAGYYGYITDTGLQLGKGKWRFVQGYYEMGQLEKINRMSEYAHDHGSPDASERTPMCNPTWAWGAHDIGPGGGFTVKDRFWVRNWIYPGLDAHVTNFVESSSLGVEFLYGATLSDVEDIAKFHRTADDLSSE